MTNVPVPQALSHLAMRTVSRLAMPGAASTALAAHAVDAANAVDAVDAAQPPDVPLNLPDTVVDWLAKLSLLYGLPFEYLVPDSRMLPVESIRFFYLDPNWLRRSIDGALSLGATSTREDVFTAAFVQQIYTAVQSAIPQVRSAVRNAPQPTSYNVGATTSGFVFRSAIVAGYPGVEIVPTLAGAAVDILRMDRLSSDIMLVLFNGIPDRVEIKQPAEGLQFGIVRGANPSTFRLSLRWVGHTTQAADAPGDQIDLANPPQQPPANPLMLDGLPMRTGTNQPPGVIDVSGTRTAVITTMGTQYLGPDETFTSAEFAVEMVLGAGVQPFAVTVPKP